MRVKYNTLNTQYDDDRPFKNIGLRKNLQLPAKYIQGEYRHHWIYLFKYLDDNSCFEIEIDYNNRFVSKTKIE